MIELYIYFLLFIQKIARVFLLPFLMIIYRRKTKQLPKIRSPLLEISAFELAEKIKKKEVSSEEVVKQYIARIREVNSIINAVVDECFKEALIAARKADKMVDGMSPIYLQLNYPLLGVPFSVKNDIGIKGLSNNEGIVACKDDLAEEDGESVRLLRAAGAIPMVITNMSEMGFTIECHNNIYGRTMNPHDLGRTSGGSSGGEGALITSGGSLFGLGTDYGGSVRIPALFCGVFAHKPTPAVIPDKGIESNCMEHCIVVGPIARYAKDLAPLMQILTNRNSKLKLDQTISMKNVKVFFKYEIDGLNLISQPVDSSIKKCISKGVEFFKNHGCAVQEAGIDFSNAEIIRMAMLFSQSTKLFNAVENGSLLNIILKNASMSYKVNALIVGMGSKLIKNRQKYVKLLEALKKQLIEMLGDNGVLLFPTLPIPAFRHNEGMTLTCVFVYCQIFNFLGFPSTQVPMGINEAGLPVGFQVIAAPYQDRLCMAAACELEHAFGGWTPPEFYKKI